MHTCYCVLLSDESLFSHDSIKAEIDYLKNQQCFNQGRIQDFLKGGSESGVDIEGGANRSIVSLKQGVWGAHRSYGVFNFG